MSDVMIDQELASIIHAVLSAAPGANPIYHEIPEHFLVPAIFFPHPELTMEGDTFFGYATRAAWYIKVFHSRNDLAYAIAHNIADTLMRCRMLIPLRDKSGTVLPDEWIRLEDPEVKALDLVGVGGAAQLTISWVSRKLYNKETVPKMMEYHLNINEETPPAAWR